MHSALPPEIWALILKDLPTESLKTLCLVSKTLMAQVRRQMYRTLVYCDAVNRSCCPRKSRQRIRDLAIFYQSLVNWDGYREITEDVCIEWTHGVEWRLIPSKDDPETESEQQFSHLVRDTAVLLAKSSTLRSLHLGIPLLTSTIPFHVDRITSLRIPISGCEYKRDDPGFETLLKLFQIPMLRRVQLDCMLRLCCIVPDSCRQRGTSNVTELTFNNCGPVSEELIDLLSWPRELQVLRFDVSFGDDTKPSATPNVHVRSDKMVNTLLPFKNSVEVLSLEVYDMFGTIPDQRGAFHSFSKLRWLRIPRDLFKLWSEDLEFSSHRDFDAAPPIQTQLPKTLETLHIDIGDNFGWREDDDAEQDDSNLSERPSENAVELLDFLSGLATPGQFPILHELWLWTSDHEQWTDTPPESRPQHFPLDCDHTRRFVSSLEQTDIEIYFDGYMWSELEVRLKCLDDPNLQGSGSPF